VKKEKIIKKSGGKQRGIIQTKKSLVGERKSGPVRGVRKREEHRNQTEVHTLSQSDARPGRADLEEVWPSGGTGDSHREGKKGTIYPSGVGKRKA